VASAHNFGRESEFPAAEGPRWSRARARTFLWGYLAGRLFLTAVSVLLSLAAFPMGRRHAAMPTPTVVPASDRAPKLLTFKLSRFRTDYRAEPLGTIGVSTWHADGDDEVRALARFDAPAYCYLIALDPDGQVRLAYPSAATDAPKRQLELRYPPGLSHPAARFDGAGLQAWLLLVSGKPLPPFANWSAVHLLRWKSVQADGVWRFDGDRMEQLQPGNRRVGKGMFDSPRPFAELCAGLGAIPDIDAIEALAYPIRPRDR
jgi:hypothetical protein